MDEIYSKEEQRLAYLLLIELLAYQFASPVRWIETQDVLFAEKNAKRVVEIGPANILATMAQRTLSTKYEAYDAVHSIQRQVLTWTKDAAEICYELEPSEEPTPKEMTKEVTLVSHTEQNDTVGALPQQVPSYHEKAASIPDSPLSPTDILRVMIAQKLKKPLIDVSSRLTIKDITGGKSTLQNELVGDIGNEFGDLPEGPEDLPLAEFGSLLTINFNGEMGKQTSSLVARMISTKMPAEFNAAAAKDYLDSRWGLGPQRQKAVLIVALVMQPAGRLAGSHEAKQFFDDAASIYASQVGIKLGSSVSSDNLGGNATNAVVDSAALERYTRSQTNLSTRQLELLAAHLKLDFRAPQRDLMNLQTVLETKQAELDLWNIEHGESYSSGIVPAFSSLKIRVYDSYWNWVRDDLLSLYYGLIAGKSRHLEPELEGRKTRIISKASTATLDFLQHYFSRPNLGKRENDNVTDKIGLELYDACKNALTSAPLFKADFVPLAPRTTINAQGLIVYDEVAREHEPTPKHYAQVMREIVLKFDQDSRYNYAILLQQSKAAVTLDLKKYDSPTEDSISHSTADKYGQMTPPEDEPFADTDLHRGAARLLNPESLPFIHLKQLKAAKWEYSGENSRMYLDCLAAAARSGITFSGKTALVTGSGLGSIGAMVLQGLIGGGATVLATTSNFSQEVTDYYRAMYTAHGARGSRLIVLPFNQGSKQDVKALVEHIYDSDKGLGLDLDYVLPFAAIAEANEIDNIDSRSELAHRLMLTNLLRLLGFIKKHKSLHSYITRPSQVILPLSPNHGTFGGDGLYSESKIALETLFNKWGSEKWGAFLTVCGANIGWTRGTGLMSGNNLIAEGIEKFGVRTFSQKEMAFNILGLMSPPVVRLCETEPVLVDLTGSLNYITDLKSVTGELRASILESSETRKLLVRENAREEFVANGDNVASLDSSRSLVEPRANLDLQFPHLLDFKTEIEPLCHKLNGLVNLDKVVVVTGIAELGPFGNARTRWDMEAHGKFSLEGCVEMAWIMGLIKHHNGPIKGREGQYSGWVDSKTGQPMSDKDIKLTYEGEILQHSGIRLVEPSMLTGRDNRMLQEIVLRDDLAPFEASKENADDFRTQHGDKADITPITGSSEYHIRLKAGAVITVPRSIDYSHLVAAQIPTGWDARCYGVPEDIINQVDKVTLYVLVCTAEALLSTGVTDPYEFYQHVHMSDIANCIGSGLGGSDALKAIYKDRALDKSVPNDILQETFINTISAWVNMLVLSSSGPIKTPVGACATALESVNVGYETIVSGEAKICLVGGCDSYGEETASEFSNMKATSNPKAETARGRTPKEMSRPSTSTRSGFVESEGCGIQILTTARLALDMGLPIRGIIALATTASDKIGRSVPAPGQGILVNAREESSIYGSQLVDPGYRRQQFEDQLESIGMWAKSAATSLSNEAADMALKGNEVPLLSYVQKRSEDIAKRALRLRNEAQSSRGNDFWRQDSRIAPLRGALATWGLTIDDLDIASLHGTSTAANDKNESEIICKQLRHLGRQKGNAILAISQKYLTGHPKGAAGAWMLNGAFQALESGLVPGNRNADNIDSAFEAFDMIHYPGRSVQTDGLKAFSATSFGFGQKSAQVIGVHPRYLFATLEEASYNDYKAKVQARQDQAYRHFHRRMITNTIFQAKEKPPYSPAMETSVLLSPNARARANENDASFSFAAKSDSRLDSNPDDALQQQKETYNNMAQQLVSGSPAGCVRTGVDIEDIKAISNSETFIARNFTPQETSYCNAAAAPQASFAGRWCAKEAVFKSLGVASKGAGAGMLEIEIESDNSGAPVVKLHGDAEARAKEAGVNNVLVSISHTESQAIAIAIANT